MRYFMVCGKIRLYRLWEILIRIINKYLSSCFLSMGGSYFIIWFIYIYFFKLQFKVKLFLSFLKKTKYIDGSKFG